MAFIYVADGIDDVLAAHLNQYADAWTGVSGKGQPFNAVAVNDPINFAISARNLDPTNSRAAQFLKADGTVLFQVDASGVKVSPDGTVASVPVTATATQTLTNKTLTSPTLATPTVSGTLGGAAGAPLVLAAPASQSLKLEAGNNNAGLKVVYQRTVGASSSTAIDPDVPTGNGLNALAFVQAGDGSSAIFSIQGGVQATVLLVQSGTSFSATNGAAGKYVLCWNTSQYQLQNQSAGAQTFAIALLPSGALV